MTMKVLGFRCTRDSIDWALIVGLTRADAKVQDQRKVTVPRGDDRGRQLAWVRLEVMALLDEHAPDRAALRLAEPGAPGGSTSTSARAEVEGVVQECLASRGVPCKRTLSSTLRGAFGVKNKTELAARENDIPCTAQIAKTRREPVVAAVALLPE